MAAAPRDEAALFQRAQRLSHHRARDAQHTDQLGLGGELAAGGVGADRDGLAE